VPASPEKALASALGGRDRAIDAGELDGRFFLNLAGIGFDAFLAGAFNRLGGERRGVARYTVATLRAAFRYRAVRYAIEADGERLDVRAILVAIANLPQYGSNIAIAPGAVPSDGLLDLVVVEDRGPLGRLGLAPRLLDRTIYEAPGVLVRRASHLVVSSDGPLDFHVDGEPHGGSARVEAHVLCGALRIRGSVPAHAASSAAGSAAGILIR
jgi:diacylglycerol kinase family enzyme